MPERGVGRQRDENPNRILQLWLPPAVAPALAWRAQAELHRELQGSLLHLVARLGPEQGHSDPEAKEKEEDYPGGFGALPEQPASTLCPHAE